MSAIPNEIIDAEIVEEETKDIVLRKIDSLRNIVKTSPLIQEYKVVSEIDIDLPVEEIAEQFLHIEKGYKAFRKSINLVARTRKEFTAPALAYQKDCIAIEKGIVSVLEPYSLRLKALKDKVEQEEARKQREIEEAEEVRVDTIKEKLSSMERLPLQMMQKTSLEIREFLDSFDIPTIQEYEEYLDKTLVLHSQIQTQLSQMADNKDLVENAQKLQDEKDVENLRLKQEEDAKLQADRDRLANEQAAFQKQKDDFEAMQREQQEILDRREAVKLADELQEKQRLERDAKVKIDEERHDAMVIETMAVLNTYSEMIILIDDIIDGKIPNVKWMVDNGN